RWKTWLSETKARTERPVRQGLATCTPTRPGAAWRVRRIRLGAPPAPCPRSSDAAAARGLQRPA
ncbi:hypothetical protein, partial [Escherichia coli]|uniref:hypothetical protein n=1 Tax=Escherichia coli TaxID=562 RepID=UPI001BFC8C12